MIVLDFSRTQNFCITSGTVLDLQGQRLSSAVDLTEHSLVTAAKEFTFEECASEAGVDGTVRRMKNKLICFFQPFKGVRIKLEAFLWLATMLTTHVSMLLTTCS